MINSQLAVGHSQEHGSVVVIALVLLVLLTIIGISASRTTEIEIMIAGNERVSKQNLYLAEGATMRAAQIMDDTDMILDPDQPVNISWVKRLDESPALKAAIFDDETWDDHSEELSVYNDYNSQIEARVLALSLGPTATTGGPSHTIAGDSGDKTPYDFEVYGRSWHRGGEGFVMVGYRGLIETP